MAEKKMNAMEKQHHFLITSLPAQGHLNPTLQLAKRLARTGAQVTFATTVHGFTRMKNPPVLDGISFASFSDGYDDDEARKKLNFDRFFSDLTEIGSRNFTELVKNLSREGRPVTFLIYTFLMPWVAEVGREMQIPSAFLSIQCATAFAIYHKYFNSRDDIYDGVGEIGTSISIKLPDLPLFSNRDLPSVLIPGNPFFASMVPILLEHIRTLEKDSKPCVLVNSFWELEESSMKAVESMNVIPIGPLVPSAFTDCSDQTDKNFGLDLFESPEKDDYLQWLDAKAEGSVVYVSFGSFVKLKKEEKIEIFHGLKATGRAYLLVIRKSDDEDEDVEALFRDGWNGEGMVVPWCSQMEVLCHKSIGCFITHCGWNSTMESIVTGVPIVGCPHFSDQTTNAKLIEDVWGNGVRARANDEGVVGRKEIERCVDVVMGNGEKVEEIRRNAAKWRGLAMEAAKENGSSQRSLKLFLEKLGSYF